ncbi:MAG: lysozyme family protein [Lachnospiraceae bacterium]|nr:lysozyme family protein [Lachnospiraceae bacterium]
MADRKNTRKNSRSKSKAGSREAQVRRNIILGLVGVLAALTACIACVGYVLLNRRAPLGISDAVEAYRPKVEQYAKEEGVPEYVDYLLAIMEVETGGAGKDVMQSSESLGLPRNTLDTDESIQQGCRYLAENLARAEKLGCDTLSAVQAYNFGIDYLDFVAERGGVQSIEVAEEFAKNKSGGEKTRYVNSVSLDYNGGYRYKFGNMFYAELVRRLVENM